MIEQLQDALAKLAAIDRLRTVVGQALTPTQQMAVSVKLSQDPEAFARWMGTDEGRAAVRELANKFTSVNTA